MATSYAQWTLSDLEKEKTRIEKAIESKSGKERKSVLAKVEALARKAGFSIEDLLSDNESVSPAKRQTRKKAGARKVSAAKGKKVPPKYRNKSDPELTWTGRGRTPLWVVEFEKKGGKRDALLIK